MTTVPAAARPRAGVFISYARSDGESIARDLYSRLQAEGIPLWRDLDRLEGGRDWWLQIAEALDEVEFMVLVMTPAAADSPIVRKEWRHARQRGVCVYPVLGVAGLSFDELPRWMRSVHFYDLDREWPKLVNDLRTRCQRQRVPFMAEDLPSESVPRPLEYERLLSHLVDRERDEPVARTAAICGAGGFGKTMLALFLCHDEVVQNVFDDGVLWVTLGENPGDQTGRVTDLIYFLSGHRPVFASLEAATAHLAELLADRDILLVIDDVWDVAHLKPFLQGGPRCARVITTRNRDTLPPGTSRVDVDAMQQPEAVALLQFGLPPGDEAALRGLAQRLGEWPLLLKLANATLRDRVGGSGQSLGDAVAYLNKALARRGLAFFDARDAVARHQAVTRTIEVSVERLAERERERFRELAVFPEEAAIPLATLERLWARTGGFDDLDTEQLAERLSRLSLVLTFDPTLRYVRLHDVIRQLLIQQAGAGLAAVHAALLDAYRPASGAWADLDRAEAYLWDHLADHLLGAGRGEELVAIVQDPRYLSAKTLARGPSRVEADLRAAERSAPGNGTLRALRRSFVQASHLLHRCESSSEVAVTLLSRIEHVPELATVATALRASIAGPYLRAAHPLPDLPDPALIRTLGGGAFTVWGCAISRDCRFVVAASYDATVTVWDVATAAERWRLTGHESWVRGCAISRGGDFIVSASFDRRLRIWDTATGELRTTLIGHTDGVTSCAVSADGRTIASTSLDETIRLWDATTGETRRVFGARWDYGEQSWLVHATSPGHLASVLHCALSPDGRRLASASSDQTVRIWDCETGDQLHVLTGHSAAAQACAFSPDGQTIASAGADGVLRIWDAERGTERHVVEPLAGPLNACAFTPDGRSVAVACNDGVLRLYDAVSGAAVAVYAGHTDVMTGCAISADGSIAVTSSMDGTVRLWELEGAASSGRAAVQRGSANACAIGRDDETVLIASPDATAAIWSASTGTRRQVLQGHTNAVRGCAVFPGMRRVVTASADKSLRIWKVFDGSTAMTLLGHRYWVNGCDVSPDGRLIVSCSGDRTVRVWDAATGTRRFTILGHQDSVNACRFSADGGFFASASADATVKLWRLDAVRDAWESPPAVERQLTLAECERLLCPVVLGGHGAGVNDCAISSDGATIVSAASRSLHLWDAAAGARRQTIEAHRGQVIGCAISPDDARLVSVGSDGSVKVWEMADGTCVATLHVDGDLTQCAWFADGRRLVVTGDGGVYFLELVV